MFSKAIKKALGRMYVAETFGKQDAQVSKIMTEIKGAESSTRVSAVHAMANISDKAMEGYRHNAFGPLKGRVVNHWTSRPQHGESWTRVLLISSFTEEDALAAAGNHIDLEYTSCYCEHDCCGHVFSYEAQAREVYAGLWLVTKWAGINV